MLIYWGCYEEHLKVGLSRFEQVDDPASKAFIPLYVERGAVARGRLHGLRSSGYGTFLDVCMMEALLNCYTVVTTLFFIY